MEIIEEKNYNNHIPTAYELFIVFPHVGGPHIVYSNTSIQIYQQPKMKKPSIIMTFLTIGIMSLMNVGGASPVLKCDYKMPDIDTVKYNPEPKDLEGGKNVYIVSVMFTVHCVHKDGRRIPGTVKFINEEIPASSREEARKFVRAEAFGRGFKVLKEQCNINKCDAEEKPKK